MSSNPASKILLADDDPGVCRTLAMVLKTAGYEVATAEHGIDAIFLLQQQVPDVVIYELNLPRVPGYDFLAVIRSRFPQIVVIALSSSLTHDDGVPSGVFADAIYIKGQNQPEKLLETVRQLLSRLSEIAAEHRKSSRAAFAVNQRLRRASAS